VNIPVHLPILWESRKKKGKAAAVQSRSPIRGDRLKPIRVLSASGWRKKPRRFIRNSGMGGSVSTYATHRMDKPLQRGHRGMEPTLRREGDLPKYLRVGQKECFPCFAGGVRTGMTDLKVVVRDDGGGPGRLRALKRLIKRGA